MDDGFNNITSTMVRKSLSSKWFIVSVIITILLILLLVWGLLYSYRTLDDFESKGLVLQEASGELLRYTKEQEMSAQMAAATGDLGWQKNYNQTSPEVNKTLKQISELAELNTVNKKVNELNIYLDDINAIEKNVFDLISHGNAEEASKLLSGWDYTQNQLKLTESTEELTTIINDYTNDQMTSAKSVTRILLVSVFVCLIVLIVSWFISIKMWKMGYKKIKEKEDEITYLSFYDSLTGLYNRRYFKKKFYQLDAYNMLPVSIIICDANRLKELNDTFGHNTGDELLIEIARIIQNAVNDKGIVSRWGGDEFGIILPNTNAEAADDVITLINEGCKASSFEPDTPSISVGFAVKTNMNQDIDHTFTLAENRMYKRKKSFRKSARQ